MYHLRAVIGTPVELHGVASADDYRLRARRFVVQRGMPASVVRDVEEHPHAYVSGGAWLVRCPCGNAPSAHPGDGTPLWPSSIAVCFECGAVTSPIFPMDRLDAEAALLERPDPMTRHYFPHKDLAAWVGEARAQTPADLRGENARQAEAIARDRARLWGSG